MSDLQIKGEWILFLYCSLSYSTLHPTVPKYSFIQLIPVLKHTVFAEFFQFIHIIYLPDATGAHAHIAKIL